MMFPTSSIPDGPAPTTQIFFAFLMSSASFTSISARMFFVMFRSLHSGYEHPEHTTQKSKLIAIDADTPILTVTDVGDTSPTSPTTISTFFRCELCEICTADGGVAFGSANVLKMAPVFSKKSFVSTRTTDSDASAMLSSASAAETPAKPPPMITTRVCRMLRDVVVSAENPSMKELMDADVFISFLCASAESVRKMEILVGKRK